MAWPFPVDAPTLDSGFVEVPTTLELVDDVDADDEDLWIAGASFANPTGGPITVRLEDGAGGVIIPDLEIPANTPAPFEWPFMPVAGLKWEASDAGLIGKVWGYK